MPEQAEWNADRKPGEPPYIKYVPWQPAAGYDLRTLGERLTTLEARVKHLEAIVHRYINRNEGEL